MVNVFIIVIPSQSRSYVFYTTSTHSCCVNVTQLNKHERTLNFGPVSRVQVTVGLSLPGVTTAHAPELEANKMQAAKWRKYRIRLLTVALLKTVFVLMLFIVHTRLFS